MSAHIPRIPLDLRQLQDLVKRELILFQHNRKPFKQVEGCKLLGRLTLRSGPSIGLYYTIIRQLQLAPKGPTHIFFCDRLLPYLKARPLPLEGVGNLKDLFHIISITEFKTSLRQPMVLNSIEE